MKICCLGSEGYLNQISRIRAGMLENGCELTNVNEASVIFCNDPAVYQDFRQVNSKAKIIFNILDYPCHIIDDKRYDLSRWPKIDWPYPKDFNVDELTHKLHWADIVTTICKEVTFQAEYFSSIEAHTIYNPIKPIYNLNLREEDKIKNSVGKPYKYLVIGRTRDLNKRNYWIPEILKGMSENPNCLAVVGSENMGYGEYIGQIHDGALNLIYNSVDYVFLLSAFKSIGLPAIESVCASKIPIVCNDDISGREFFEPIEVPPNPQEIVKCLKSEEWNNRARNFVNLYENVYKERFSPKQIAKNILDLV